MINAMSAHKNMIIKSVNLDNYVLVIKELRSRLKYVIFVKINLKKNN